LDDITGIGKLAESEVVRKAYGDLIASPATEIGKLSGDAIRTLRLLTAPIQLLAALQERLDKWLNRIREAVPEARQIEAAPEIAGPVLLNLRFISEDNNLQDLYLNLLILAVDSENCHKAHPGFIRVIEQLSPRDAQFLEILSLRSPIERRSQHCPDFPEATAVQQSGKPFDSWSLNEIQASLDLLQGLSVIKFDHATFVEISGPGYTETNISLTQYGMNFVNACIPPLGQPKKNSG
jgi:Abortive infection alpha